ncbi:MAG: hypothetical protein JW825_06090 [Candidatus Methanofastidiosa archaeon]|nr:hypothetical protein [Candidatus Methanofastidiosa archaeon]
MTKATKSPKLEKDTQRTLGRSKARRYIIEYMLSKYPENVSHYEIVSRMHLPPISMKRQDQIEHHIKELESDMDAIESDYIKSDSSSIKIYRLKEDEESLMRVLVEIMDSPDRLALIRSRYFMPLVKEERILDSMKRWSKDHRAMLKEGLKLAESEKGEGIAVGAHFERIDCIVSNLMGDARSIPTILSIPVLLYMLTNREEGAARFWLFLDELNTNYPEIISFGGVLKDMEACNEET